MANQMNRKIDLTDLECEAVLAVVAGSVPTLLQARQRLLEVKRDLPAKHPCKTLLFDLVGCIDQAIRNANDRRASQLLSDLDMALGEVDGVIQLGDIALARKLLHYRVSFLLDQITRIPEYIIDAIERVKGDVYDHVHDTYRDRIATAEHRLTAREIEIGQEQAVLAKELRTRFEANIKNGNVNAARRILQQMEGKHHAATLAHFGSVEKRVQFFAEKQRELERALAEIRVRQANKKQRRQLVAAS